MEQLTHIGLTSDEINTLLEFNQFSLDKLADKRLNAEDLGDEHDRIIFCQHIEDLLKEKDELEKMLCAANDAESCER